MKQKIFKYKQRVNLNQDINSFEEEIKTLCKKYNFNQYIQIYYAFILPKKESFFRSLFSYKIDYSPDNKSNLTTPRQNLLSAYRATMGYACSSLYCNKIIKGNSAINNNQLLFKMNINSLPVYDCSYLYNAGDVVKSDKGDIFVYDPSEDSNKSTYPITDRTTWKTLKEFKELSKPQQSE